MSQILALLIIFGENDVMFFDEDDDDFCRHCDELLEEDEDTGELICPNGCLDQYDDEEDLDGDLYDEDLEEELEYLDAVLEDEEGSW